MVLLDPIVESRIALLDNVFSVPVVTVIPSDPFTKRTETHSIANIPRIKQFTIPLSIRNILDVSHRFTDKALGFPK
jgi:hypothetical protein